MTQPANKSSNGNHSPSLEELSLAQTALFVLGSLVFLTGSGIAFYVAWQNYKEKHVTTETE